MAANGIDLLNNNGNVQTGAESVVCVSQLRETSDQGIIVMERSFPPTCEKMR